MKLKEYDVFVDLDGVIAAFDRRVLDIFGKPVHAFESKKEFWKRLTEHDSHVEKFFRYLPKMPDADDLINHLKTLGCRSLQFLTASGYTPSDAGQQKTEWSREHYPFMDCIVVRKSADKAKYAHEKAILIDDRDKSIIPWVEAGGIGILHKSASDTIKKLEELF